MQPVVRVAKAGCTEAAVHADGEWIAQRHGHEGVGTFGSHCRGCAPQLQSPAVAPFELTVLPIIWAELWWQLWEPWHFSEAKGSMEVGRRAASAGALELLTMCVREPPLHSCFWRHGNLESGCGSDAKTNEVLGPLPFIIFLTAPCCTQSLHPLHLCCSCITPFVFLPTFAPSVLPSLHFWKCDPPSISLFFYQFFSSAVLYGSIALPEITGKCDLLERKGNRQVEEN